MKWHIVLIFFILSFTSVAQYDTSTVNYTDPQGLRQGYWVKKYPDGKKYIEGTFKDGKRTGVFRQYHENGVLAARLIYSLHHDTVKAEFFHENGNLMSKGIYIGEQKRYGEWNYYDRKGILSSKEFFNINGQKDSVEYVYYLDGSIAKITHYKNGFKTGEVKEYFQDGTLKFEGTYIDNNLNGIVKFYYPDGKLKQIGAYRDAVRHGTWTYYNRNGKVAAKEKYDLGRLLNREIYDENVDKLILEPTPQDSLEIMDIDELPEKDE